VDCPVHEITGSMKHKNSRAALESYNSYFDVKDVDKNKQTLKAIDDEIDTQENKVAKFKPKDDDDNEEAENVHGPSKTDDIELKVVEPKHDSMNKGIKK